MKGPKVLVGGVVNLEQGRVAAEFLDAVKGIDYGNREIFLLDVSGENRKGSQLDKGMEIERGEAKNSQDETLASNRNRLGEKALEGKFDFLLLADFGQAVPADTVKALLAHGKKVCSALCLKPAALETEAGGEAITIKTFQPMAARAEAGKMAGLQLDDVLPGRLMKVDACFLGCVLIHRDVVEKVKFRFEEKKGDSECFAEDCKKNGFELWLDSGTVCKNILARGKAI